MIEYFVNYIPNKMEDGFEHFCAWKPGKKCGIR